MPPQTSYSQKPLKLSKKQKEIVKKMQDGWIMIMGASETTGRPYQLVSKGYENTYFNSTVFSALLSKNMIYQEPRFHEWVLTETGENIDL